jgi:hypothetical protein
MEEKPAPIRRPWSQITIRELVMLTLVVAMAMGWWLDRRQLMEANYAARYSVWNWESKAGILAETLRRNGWQVELEPISTVPPPGDVNAARVIP